jgi:hypothetical protein
MRLASALALSAALDRALALNVARSDAIEAEPLMPFRQTLDNYADLQYYGNITVGRQQLHAVLDTGSIEFVVLSDRCLRCGTMEKYHYRVSSAYQQGNADTVLSYGSGTLDVQVAYDSVTAGHLSTTGVPFWEVGSADMPLLSSSDFQAIVGLGPIPEGTRMLSPDTEGSDGAAAVLLMKFGIDRFGVCLGREPASPGYFTWNDDSLHRSTAHFTTLKVPQTGYWMLPLTDVSIGNTVIDCSQGCGAVVDTGTSLLAMPDSAQARLERAVAHLKGECGDLSKWPDFRFKLSGRPFSLPADSYIGAVEGDVSEEMQTNFKPKPVAAATSLYATSANKSQADKCEVSVMNVALDSDLGAIWILGAPFFRKYYSIFVQSQHSPSVSFAVASDDCKPMAATGMLLKPPRTLPRRINASSVRISPWVKRFNAMEVNRSNETRKLPHRRSS